ncbi:MAG TPA: hypothetical protein PK821_05770, partial [Victivallales bacterium]|nr:hypothetical protein [Victivallales bacterium]
PIRIVEAWAPMHSHQFLPVPEYYEHSWLTRLRVPLREHLGSLVLIDSEVDMAVIRFEKFVHLYAKQGYTHILLDDQDYLVLFDKHPEIYPPESHFRKRHLQCRAMFRRLIDICSKYNMKFILYCQEFGYTPPMKDYIGEISHDNPKLWELFEEKYDEILGCFPEIDAFMFKMSDTFADQEGWYYHNDFYRRTIQSNGSREEAIGNLKRFVDHAYETIVRKHGKKFMYRTWDTNHRIHVDVEMHKKLFAGIDDEKVFVLLKHVQGDFMVSNPPHPGIGAMNNQIVEFQFKLEHDGQGMLPLYIGETYEDSLRDCAAKGVKGIWAWPIGGGQCSISNITDFKGFTRFVEANEFVFSNLMMDLSKSHKKHLKVWGDIILGNGNGKAILKVFEIELKAMNLLANFGDLWTGSREYSFSKFHHLWFYEWHQFRLGKGTPDKDLAGDIIKKEVLPYISDIDKAVERMHEAASYFSKAYREFEKSVKLVKGHDSDYLAMRYNLKGTEMFGRLAACWVESLLKYHSGKYTKEQMIEVLDELEKRKEMYDRPFGVFVTQCIDYFICMAKK